MITIWALFYNVQSLINLCIRKCNHILLFKLFFSMFCQIADPFVQMNILFHPTQVPNIEQTFHFTIIKNNSQPKLFIS